MAAIDAFGSPILSALRSLERDEPLNMRELTVAAKVSPAAARGILATLLDLKLVTVRRTKQGALRIAEIELTATGRRLARHVAAIDALLPPR